MAWSLKRKIAIGVVVALVILVVLGIVTGLFFQQEWDMDDITCVSNPIQELTTKIQTAQNGIDTPTNAICMKSGGRLLPNAITAQLNNLNSVTFNCMEGAAVCSGANPPVTFPTSDSVQANKDVRFKGIIHCDFLQNGNYDCTISIRSA